MREPGLKYGAPLTEDEIERLRCLLGNHIHEDSGGEHRVCIVCGERELPK